MTAAVPDRAVVFGEIGLSGEIRAVSQMDNRLKEAAKLGFERAIVPKRQARAGKNSDPHNGLRQKSIGHLAELLPLFETPAGQSGIRAGSRGRG